MKNSKLLKAFWEKYSKYLFFLPYIITIIFGLLLFDSKISIGGDDADYIISAKKFAESINFPGWHGTLYPIILSIPISIFGLNLLILKSTSLLFILIHLLFFHLAFKNRINDILLLFSLLILSVNPFLLTNASHTSNEPFYLALQSFAFYFLFKLIDCNYQNIKEKLRLGIIIGLICFLLGQTKHIGYSFFIITILFFLLHRKWKEIMFISLSLMLFMLLFYAYKYYFWNNSGIGFESQLLSLFYKNPYYPNLGYENIDGLIERLLTNSNLYLSNSIIKISGIMSLSSDSKPWLVSISIIILIIYMIISSYKTNKYIFCISLYTFVFSFTTFLSLQIMWGQDRLMIPVYPLLLIILLFPLYNISIMELRKVLILFSFVILIIVGITRTYTLARKNSYSLKSHFSGNELYGYTNDYKNYIRTCRWVEKNIAPSQVIACRKSSFASIYAGGRYFVNISHIPYSSIDSLKLHFKNTLIISVEDYMRFAQYEYKYGLRDYFHSYIIYPNSWFVLFSYPDEKEILFKNLMSQLKITNVSNLNSFLESIKQKNITCQHIHPYTLIDFLSNRNISYLIYANLRLNPKINNRETLNAVERIIDYIELRYPGYYDEVIKYGNENDEYASLIKINFDYIKQFNK